MISVEPRDVAAPVVKALLQEFHHLRDNPGDIKQETSVGGGVIVSFETAFLNERDLERLLGIRASGTFPRFDLYITHSKIGVRVELWLRS